MNCSRFREVLDELDREGTEGFAVREVALAHAESCSSCALLLIDSEALDFALKGFALSVAREEAPPQVEAGLLEEFRHQRVASSSRRVRWQLVALGTAAAVLLALGFALHHQLTSASPAGRLQSVGVSPVAPAPNSADTSATDSGGQGEMVAENQLLDSGGGTDFVALPYADGSDARDGGAIVRVVLSRPALASLGLPVTDMAASDRIPAEIVVSEDGTPQAIRLVSESSSDQQQ